MTEETPKKRRRWTYQIDLGPLSLFVWLACIFFFIAWIFVLGIFVGRGLLPDKINDLSGLKGEINKLQNTVQTKNMMEEKTPTSSGVSEKEPELAFYDKLTTKKEEARVEVPTEAASETQKSSPITIPVKETASIQQPAEEKKIQVQAASPDGDKKTAAPTVASTPVASTAKTGAGKYTIQLAAIAERAKAEKTIKQLIEKGFDAYYYETKVKNKTLYRIRCGRFSDRAEAVKTALKLQEKTGYKGYVTGSE